MMGESEREWYLGKKLADDSVSEFTPILAQMIVRQQDPKPTFDMIHKMTQAYLKDSNLKNVETMKKRSSKITSMNEALWFEICEHLKVSPKARDFVNVFIPNFSRMSARWTKPRAATSTRSR